MSVKKEASGRRSVQIEFEVPGTPEQVWNAIATGPGISSWFVPTEIEERDGKPVAMKLSFGPGMEISTAITNYDAPRMYRTEATGFVPGSPAIANEWSVEARAGGVCVVRIVQSLFASTDDWDYQLESAKGGLASFLEILRVYLTHFTDQRSAMMKFVAPAAGTESEAWDALTTALNVKGLNVGQRFAGSKAAPTFSGVVEYLTHNPNDALLRLDQPGPGVLALGIMNFPGAPLMIAMNFYMYGDNAPETIARETAGWQAWIDEHFPAPASSMQNV